MQNSTYTSPQSLLCLTNSPTPLLSLLPLLYFFTQFLRVASQHFSTALHHFSTDSSLSHNFSTVLQTISPLHACTSLYHFSTDSTLSLHCTSSHNFLTSLVPVHFTLHISNVAIANHSLKIILNKYDFCSGSNIRVNPTEFGVFGVNPTEFGVFGVNPTEFGVFGVNPPELDIFGVLSTVDLNLTLPHWG